MDFSFFFTYFYTAKNSPVKLSYIRYCFLILQLFGGSLLMSGQSNGNSTVTIIGGDPGTENQGINSIVNSESPPMDGRQLAEPQNIEPTLENGFHIRYRIDTPSHQEEGRLVGDEYASISAGVSATTSGSSGGSKIKKRRLASIAELSFNFKKRYKAMVPKRKKKYRPNVCGRF